MDLKININMNKSIEDLEENFKNEKIRIIMLNNDGSLTTMSSEHQLNHHMYFNEYYKLINKEISRASWNSKRLEKLMDVNYLILLNVVNESKMIFLDFGRNNKVGIYGYFILPLDLTEEQFTSLERLQDHFAKYRDMQIAPIMVEDGCAVFGEDIFADGNNVVSKIGDLYVKTGSQYRSKFSERINQKSKNKSIRRG